MKYFVLICLLLTGCSNDCEENGGKLVLTGYVPTWQTISGISTMIMHPIYNCVIVKKEEQK